MLRLPVIATALLAFGAGAVTVSQEPVIQACAGVDGVLRTVADTADCRDYETGLEWSRVGPRGPQGEQGPPGPPGSGVDRLYYEIDLRSEIINEVQDPSDVSTPEESYDARYSDVAGWDGHRLDGQDIPDHASVSVHFFPTIAEGNRVCVTLRDRLEGIALTSESCVETSTCAPTDGSFGEFKNFSVSPMAVDIPDREFVPFAYYEVTSREGCPGQNPPTGASFDGPYLAVSL